MREASEIGFEIRLEESVSESIPSHGRLESTRHDCRVFGARHDVDAGVAAGHVDRCVIHVVRQPSVRARRGGGESGAAALPEALGAESWHCR